MSEKHALVASYSIPEADRDSGGRRLLDLIDFLREGGYSITFCAASPITKPDAAKDLQRSGIAVLDGMATRKSGVGPEPILHEILAARRVDLALLAFWPVAELYLPIFRRVCPTVPVLVDSVDLHCLRHARRLFRGPGSGLKLLDGKFAAQLIGELNVYAAADGVLTVSEKEAALIQDFCGGAARTFCVPDCEDFSPNSRPFAERQGILALGSYQHAPNVQAIGFLCQEILPHVDKKQLRAHPLYVVGNGLDEQIHEATRHTPNAQLVGWVPSVTSYFERARVSVVPLRYGAGTKRKVVQALLSGTPTVTTTIGAEGLDLIHEQHALIADEATDFAMSIERLLTDESLWQRLAENGRALMLATHSRDVARRQFMTALEAVQKAPPHPAVLPEITARDFFNRCDYSYLDRLSSQIQFFLAKCVPPDATVIVLSGGHEQFLDLGGCSAWHFPQTEDSEPMLCTPRRSAEVLASLERLRQQGGNYLLIPFPYYWWLNHFPEFGTYVENSCRLIASKDEVGKIFLLNAPALTLATKGSPYFRISSSLKRLHLRELFGSAVRFLRREMFR